MTDPLITTLATERFVQYQLYSLVPDFELMLAGPIEGFIAPDSEGRLVGKSDYALRAGANGWTLVQGKEPHNFGPPERQDAYRTPKDRIMLVLTHPRAGESTVTLLIPEGDKGEPESFMGCQFEVVNLETVRSQARVEEGPPASPSDEETDPGPGSDDIPF